MANPMKGEIAFEVEGRDYTLLLNLGAIIAIEADFGVPMAAVAQSLEEGAPILDQLRVFRHCLKARHAALDADGAMALAEALGARGLPTLLGRAIRSAYEIPEDEQDPEAADDGAARPRKGAKAQPGAPAFLSGSD